MEKIRPKAMIKSVQEARAWSLWVVNYFNSCRSIELFPWLESGNDVERFGVRVVRSPRYAGVLIAAGDITRKAVKHVKRIHDQMHACMQISDSKYIILIYLLHFSFPKGYFFSPALMGT